MEPLTYNFVNPAEAIMNGVKLGAGIRQSQQEAAINDMKLQQAALAQQAAMQQQATLRALAMKPDAGHEDYARVMTMYPGLAENLGKSFKVLDEGQQKNALEFGSRVYAAQLSGNNDLAAQLLEERAKADPAQAQHYTTMAQLVRQNPQAARMVGALTLSAAMGPDKFATAFTGLNSDARAQEKQPADVATATANAVKAQAEAGAAPQTVALNNQKTAEEIRASREKLALDAKRLNLDGDKFNLEFDTKLEELRQKRAQGVTLTAGMEKLQADAVGTSLTAKGASDQATRLAELLRKDPQSGGMWSWTANQWREKFGSDSPLLDLRREYARIRNQGLLADLPPGPASDRDIATMKEGFPSENADGETLARWLDAYGKVQKAIALKEEAKADWISSVGALKTAPQDIEVMGIRVPKGTSFVDFIRRGVKPEQATERPASRTGYLEKYGK